MIVEGGYIRVVQDVRGKHGSEGDYVINRPLRGPQNPTPVDHATDTYDTIDWLVKNVPESNGKVGILGISYDGFLPLMALVNPHPALKVSVPMNPMVDGWMGDDWFHNGAFRQHQCQLHLRSGRHAQGGRTSGGAATTTTTTCSCKRARRASWVAAAASISSASGASSSSIPPTTPSGATRPWTSCSPQQPLKVPVMLVHSLWDQEDIYGALAVYKAIKPKDTDNDKVFLVMGPWHHGQDDRRRQFAGRRASSAATPALYFRQQILRAVSRPVSERRRPEGRHRPRHRVRDRHQRLAPAPAWPPNARAASAVKATPLYLRAGSEAELRSRRSPAIRPSTSTSPIPPNRSPSARVPSSPWDTKRATTGRAGSSTTSARRRDGPMS